MERAAVAGTARAAKGQAEFIWQTGWPTRENVENMGLRRLHGD